MICLDFTSEYLFFPPSSNLRSQKEWLESFAKHFSSIFIYMIIMENMKCLCQHYTSLVSMSYTILEIFNKINLFHPIKWERGGEMLKSYVELTERKTNGEGERERERD